MAKLYYEDKYYEAKLPDGSIVFTRTRYILDALNYYRNQCLKIISDSNHQADSAPKIMMVESFEEMMKHINKLTNTQIRVKKAQNALMKIDKIIAKLTTPTPPTQQINPQNDSFGGFEK